MPEFQISQTLFAYVERLSGQTGDQNITYTIKEDGVTLVAVGAWITDKPSLHYLKIQDKKSSWGFAPLIGGWRANGRGVYGLSNLDIGPLDRGSRVLIGTFNLESSDVFWGTMIFRRKKK